MLDKSVAITYVDALLEVAAKKKKFEQVGKDLDLVSKIITKHDGLKRLLLHPSVSRDEKKDIIRRIFGESISDTTRNFLYLLVDRRKERILEFIPDVYRNVVNEKKGILRAVVQSTVPITGERLDNLKKHLDKLTGKEVEVDVVQDPDILGGLVIQIENMMIDGSVAGRLKNLKTRLLELHTA